ncbi:DNA mismatch repair protein MutS [Natroniella sulfidigena]|uniref:DNA mismatch repair protein MutS n=1 Tax=Natroniella sulfidigena TaxID=723921 RepID=UPI002009FAB1|nr:DNA mismatch repair protein MutS [Natroniella sulfidigena]MCK8817686.1 DNA mismatch repair protein MutS [Natroniella sulfidigena]
MAKLTPMMQQYYSIKDEYQDAILFFRLGDFYEMFNDDAKVAARELELTLTARNKGKGDKIPMAGVPYHSAESYLAQLIDKGYRVAICEQVEDPSETSGLVKREVVRVITPGTVVNNNMLEDKDNNYLVAVVSGAEGYGFSVVDVSTGEFMVTQLDGSAPQEKVIDELSRINPAEVLLDQGVEKNEQIMDFMAAQIAPIKTKIADSFSYDRAYELLTDHFETVTLEGFGCEGLSLAIEAAGAALDFLIETQKRSLKHLNRLSTYSTTDYMVLDANTRRNLELVETMRDKSRKGSLLWVLDQTVTAMGGRTLRRWIEQPLLEVDKINQRLDAVEEIAGNIFLKEELKELLDQVYDIERLIGKVVYGSANARDLIALRNSLAVIPELKELLAQFSSTKLVTLEESLDQLEDVTELITSAIREEPPTTITEGGVIKRGYDEELDQLLEAMTNGKDWIVNLQEQERERTGISSLKVGHNKVHGYYIEVTKANLDAVPDDYVRKQTLSNSERYITPELKEKESVILGAEEKSEELEYKLFVRVREQVAEETERIQQSANILAQLDALLSLAEVALNNDYAKPTVEANEEIEISKGRHPVVEQMMDEEVFVPNDTYLDGEEDRFSIITGPNMSGKSTYMRQVALISLLAQIGSFVPAEEAKIGIVDRIFTRVGASDDLTTGQSTFMVEMNEVANILNNATSQSLIILDEVGRGTSTYDGLSIAWAVIEYISDLDKIGAKSLFATHYHELTELEDELPGVKNYNVAVQEEGERVVFLRKIIPGSADQSYGIEVAKRAGIPKQVIERSKVILAELEKDEVETVKLATEEQKASYQQQEEKEEIKEKVTQMPLFTPANDQLTKELSQLDIMSMTPLEAMNQLHQLKQKAQKRLAEQFDSAYKE